MIQFLVGGVRYDATGSFTYNLGRPLRAAHVGSDGVHGFTEVPQVPFVEGAITDRQSVDLDALLTARDVTVVLLLANSKTIMLRDAWYAQEGSVSTEAGEVAVRFEGLSAEEV
jgi:hypothetical protein